MSNAVPTTRDEDHHPGRGRIALALTLLLTLAGLAVLAGQASGQSTRPAERGEMTVEQVLARHVDATGGVEAHRQAESQRQTGKVVLPVMNDLEGELTILVARPDSIRVTVDVPRGGRFEQGASGETAWSLDRFTGPKLMSDPERRLLQRSVDPPDGGDLDRYASATVAGVEAVADVPGEDGPVEVVRIDLETDDGVKLSEFFDVETGLRVKRMAEWDGDFGDERREIVYGDYREVGDRGLLVPFRSRQQAMGAAIEVHIENVEVNPDLNADAFAPPPEVRDLM